MLVLVLFAFILVGCGGGEVSQRAKDSTLIVLAASSLSDVFGELEGTFEEQNLGTDIQVGFAGSLELLLQIQQRAPADVFTSADETMLATTVEEGLVTKPQNFVESSCDNRYSR